MSRKSNGYITVRELKKRKRSSSTPGREKTDRCKATPLEKGVARHNRSWKMPEYPNVLRKWETKNQK